MLAHHQTLYHHPDEDDVLTVQTSAANCHLGQLLLEADWAEAARHLATPEGRRDASEEDPLGLLLGDGRGPRMPRSDSTALFAALYVRAPFDIIYRLHLAAPDRAHPPRDLAYALSVSPADERARLPRLTQVMPDRTRAWTAAEYARILHLLLRPFVLANPGRPAAAPATLMNLGSAWVCAANVHRTPLAMAAHSPDVPPSIVWWLCALEPRAMERTCALPGSRDRTIPLVLAAAAPVPPKSSPDYSVAVEQRWKKVLLLTFSQAQYLEQRTLVMQDAASTHDEDADRSAALLLAGPTRHQIERTCEEAAGRGEWELVREFLKRYHRPDGNARLVDGAGASPLLDKLRAALARYDAGTDTALQMRELGRVTERACKKMGPITRSIDVLADRISGVLPSLGKKRDGSAGGIVPRMS